MVVIVICFNSVGDMINWIMLVLCINYVCLGFLYLIVFSLFSCCLFIYYLWFELWLSEVTFVCGFDGCFVAVWLLVVCYLIVLFSSVIVFN